jgi:hypothetical protein
MLGSDVAVVYLNCEDFKRHTFPNVLIEILSALFREINGHLKGWFGGKRALKILIADILTKLEELKKGADSREVEVRDKTGSEFSGESHASAGSSAGGVEAKVDGKIAAKKTEETERTFKEHQEKLRELNQWLPRLKESVRKFFELSKKKKTIYIQIDDLYHLRRADQAFVVDYIHRLCKDVPLFFKVATIRHASTLYVDREGQPIGAQERHDFQPINIDYTFNNFKQTRDQNWQILQEFARRAGWSKSELEGLFRGQGFARLVMAGGGVPRDVLSLFLDLLNSGQPIGKDEVRVLSRTNFERRIEELKQDSHADEQDSLLKGIYVLRAFCFDKKTNVFVVPERMMQQNDALRSLFNRLMDYRIIHSSGNALTHKSQEGTYQAFAIDIGCYAHLRKLTKRLNEIDVSATDAKEKMRSAPIFEESRIKELFSKVPDNIEQALLAEEAEAEAAA